MSMVDDPQASLADYSGTRTYTLTDDDMALARSKGRERDGKGFDGTVDIDSTEAHVLGMKGELAFGNLYGLPVDLSYNDSGGDSGSDFTVEYRGRVRRVNVKVSTYYDDPWLKVRPSRVSQPSDIYVLGGVDGRTVRFVGWVDSETVAAQPITTRTGHSRNHVVEPGQLRPMFSPYDLTGVDRP